MSSYFYIGSVLGMVIFFIMVYEEASKNFKLVSIPDTGKGLFVGVVIGVLLLIILPLFFRK